MTPLHTDPNGSDVVAAFENQTDAERVVRQLRYAGFRNREIGQFAWLPLGGLKNLRDHDYSRECAAAGGVAGVVFGLWLAPVLSDRLVAFLSVPRLFELTVLCAAGAALFAGLIGWEIGTRLHEAGAPAPAVDPEAGPFIVTVPAGEAREWVWSVVRQHHGYRADPAAPMQPHAV